MDMNYYDKYKRLGLNIAYYRKNNNLTQIMLVEFLGIDRTHMGHIETARTGVSLDVLFRISDILKVPIHKFFEFRD